MKSFHAILKYTNHQLVGRKTGKNITKTINTIKLINANSRLVLQNHEIENRVAELLIAHNELVYQNQEKEKRAIELSLAYKELSFQKIEKNKRITELTFVSKELEKAEKYQSDYVLGLKEIMYITSHNVRLPLANIIGISELLNQIDNTPEEINICIDYLKQSALSLETSTKELAFYIANLEQISVNK